MDLWVLCTAKLLLKSEVVRDTGIEPVTSTMSM
jgi:hypothetical protein